MTLDIDPRYDLLFENDTTSAICPQMYPDEGRSAAVSSADPLADRLLQIKLDFLNRPSRWGKSRDSELRDASVNIERARRQHVTLNATASEIATRRISCADQEVDESVDELPVEGVAVHVRRKVLGRDTFTVPASVLFRKRPIPVIDQCDLESGDD
ncbi:MAG: hypothetical protein HZB26_20570 [Candidatus Hydrogenedentes bacterium]|nr:hypothetical protein [Candidatus Hydrogenedentota bacterium]